MTDTIHKVVNGELIPLTADEIAEFEARQAEEAAGAVDREWASVRDERNRRLTACDWTQLPDAPVNAADWASYRQALRDITTQSDPFNIQWPTEPGA